MKNLKKYISKRTLLLAIVAIAAFLRFWNLGGNPSHLSPDEAALGYNAYSILKTGRDEYGEFMPVIFKSFGDFKPGLYVYLAVPFVATLGLTEVAVRAPSAIAGVVAVYLLFSLVRELFKSKISVFKSKLDSESLALVSAFVLAITPWHVHLSHGAWEVNVALTLTLAGVYFFLKSLEKQKYLVYSALFFASTLITYQGAKLSSAIVLVILVIIHRKQLFKFRKKLLSKSVLLALLVALPVLFSLFQGKTGRLAVFSVFSYKRPDEYLQNFLNEADVDKGSATYYLFYSEGLNFARGIMGRWFNHYSDRFLFFTGDYQNVKHSPPYHGMLLLSDIVFTSLGLVFLIKLGWKKNTQFVWWWLLLAPLPAALSRDQVHAIRSYNMVIPLTILSAMGICMVFVWARKYSRLIRKSFYLAVATIILGSFVYFVDSYYVHQPIHHANEWSYGFREAVREITPVQDDYDRIVFKQSYAQPYIYFLFYQKYDPAKYQRKASLQESSYGDVGLVKRLDNIYFEDFAWPAPAKRGDLVVGGPIAVPATYYEASYELVKEINQPNGNIAFRIVKLKDN